MATDWGGLVSTILAGASGLVENLFGRDMEAEAEAKRASLGEAPTFEIPQSQEDYKALMKTRSRQDMSGYADMVSQLDAQASYQASSAAQAAGTQYGALAGSNAAQMNRQKQLRKLGIANAGYQSQAEAQAIQAQKAGSAYDQMAFEYNQWLPWQIKKNEIASIRGTGQQQLMSGLDTAAAAGIYGSSLFGNNQQQGATPPQQGGNPGWYYNNPYSNSGMDEAYGFDPNMRGY